MAHNARVKKVLDDATELSPSEFQELVAGLEEVKERRLDGSGAAGSRPAAPANDQTPTPRCGGAELVRLLKGLTPDPRFADDLEAAVREMRSEPATSPWDR